MSDYPFSQADLEDIRAHGLTPETVNAQLRMFARGVAAPELIAPCTINNGIMPLETETVRRLAAVFRQAVDNGRLAKFVPASGAATRMFKDLIAAHQKPGGESPASDKSVTALLANLNRFACRDALWKAMEQDGVNHDDLTGEGGSAAVLKYLLTPSGLGYADLPKGLILFHRYRDEAASASYSRTAFEEHLAEAAELFADRNHRCRVHFTVPLAHETAIKEHLRSGGAQIEGRYGVSPEVTFSSQDPATDTIAAASDNTPFRDRNGRLVFRPGGHGALLGNLDRLAEDLLFIKNIDNIAMEPLRRKTAPAIAAMCGLLVELQQQVFACLERLTARDADRDLIEEVTAWASRHLNLFLTDIITGDAPVEEKELLIGRLNRPLRVCGVVKNTGEPGGGPFWIKDSRGDISVQIIEEAQVDMTAAGQKEIWLSSTHFNPVIIACAVRDYTGRPFRLADFADPLAGIITEKSKDGRSLKALEHPGLWNGAMAYWNTVFVELPSDAFNPVKTVFDLLRKGHCPD
ncbi:MAG: DUF4301 family protein [Thermodesulfobacteriota bacterium]